MTDSGGDFILKWSKQLLATPSPSARLQGDKINLPASALEQLLAANTRPATSAYSNAWTSFLDGSASATQNDSPQPLTFRVVNPDTGSVVYAGIREFSASDDTVELSSFLWDALGLEKVAGKDSHDEAVVTRLLTIHVQQLPKGQQVRLRPLESGYDVEDWKALLERHLRNNFTTLTKNEVLSVSYGKSEFRFLVDKIVPDGDAICIVDTDLEVDIEPLSEEQAKESLAQRQAKQNGSVDLQGNTKGGDVGLGSVDGYVSPGQYVDYVFKGLEMVPNATLSIDLESSVSEDVDIYVNPFSSSHRGRPRQDCYVYADNGSSKTKRIKLRHGDPELKGMESFSIAVHAYAGARGGPNNGKAVSRSFNLKIREENQSTVPSDHDMHQMTGNEARPGDVQCSNCLQWVPERTLVLHQNFCLRNNVICKQCHRVFKKDSMDFREHWHCPHDEARGDSASSKDKHDHLYHTPAVCKDCGQEESSIAALARHRTTSCPEKLILCQFCHLEVPQKGPDDPDMFDSAVVFSGLTPHEYAEGARTTECHLCGHITRLRDMPSHLKHHDLDRKTRSAPRICRNINCGRTIDGIAENGKPKITTTFHNDLGLCDQCFAPLHNTAHDPEGKGLRRRIERRYLTQLVSGCGKPWCRNAYCKTGRLYNTSVPAVPGAEGGPISTKVALTMIKPILDTATVQSTPLHFCVDERSQVSRTLAEHLTNEDGGRGFALEWCIAGLEAEKGDIGKARVWLNNWAPTRAESRG